MSNLSHGLEIPENLAIYPNEVDAILLEYECAYIDANGSDPLLHKISDNIYAIGDIGMAERIHIVEFPRMTRVLWERVANRNAKDHTGSVIALFNRLIPMKLSDTLEKLHGQRHEIF